MEEDQKRFSRNSDLLHLINRIDSKAAALAAKTERCKMLKVMLTSIAPQLCCCYSKAYQTCCCTVPKVLTRQTPYTYAIHAYTIRRIGMLLSVYLHAMPVVYTTMGII